MSARADSAIAVSSIKSLWTWTLFAIPGFPEIDYNSRSSRASAVKISLNVGQVRENGTKRFNALHSSLYSPVWNIWMNALVVICVVVKGGIRL